MLKSSLDALKRRAGRVTARLRGLPHPSRFSKGGDHAPPRFIRHIAVRIALVACSHAEAPSSLLRIRILALHHFQLLSTAALAKYPAPAHLVSDGKVLAKAHRGENPKSHAEYVALEDKLSNETLAGATVYTTLEPCVKRNPPKICCAERLANRRVARVL